MGLLDLIFGQKKPKYPVITNDMMQPVDNKITAADAKRIYKQFMLQIGYCEDKQEADMCASSLADAINDHQEILQFELDDLKRSFEDAHQDDRETLKDLKADLKKSKDETIRADLQSEISEIEQDMANDDEEIKQAAAALSSFKQCKRAFLIRYINEELHGTSDA